MQAVPRGREQCWAPSRSSLPSGRESPERRTLVLNSPICSIPHPHPLPCLHLSPRSPPSQAFFCVLEKSPNQDVKSQPPPSYPPWLYFKLLRPLRQAEEVTRSPWWATEGDALSPPGVPVSVPTPPTLCPLLPDAQDDNRGNGRLLFEYPRIQCFCLLPAVQLASLWTSRRGGGERVWDLWLGSH